MSYTVGEFSSALNGIVTSLNGIAGRLGACQLDAEINNTPGRVVVCQTPIVVGDQCMAPKDESSITVSHLLEAVEALRDWALDVNKKLSEYPSTAAIDADSGTSPGL